MADSNLKKVVIIGAGGDMTGRFLTGVASHIGPGYAFELRDMDVSIASQRLDLFSGMKAEAHQMDLFDSDELADAVKGAYIVVNGAGPYHRTADIVRRAALKANAAYLDIDDDVESTLAGFELDAAARDAGIPLFIGCGASPGLTNVLALDLAQRIDEIHQIDVVWCVGDEGPQEPGRSVIAHTLHMGTGTYTGWSGGERASKPSFENTTRWSFLGLDRQSFYECAHPEAIMLGRSLKSVRDVVCWGSLHPGPINGVLRGIAEAEKDGRLTTDEAITYLQQQIAGKPGDKKAEREAIRGMKAQVKRGETTWFEFCDFLLRDTLKIRYQTKAATAAIVEGLKDGQLVRLARFIDSSHKNSPLKSMDVSTGLSEAAFFLEAIKNLKDHRGTLTPEQWVDPNRFYSRLESLLGIPQSNWLSPVQLLATENAKPRLLVEA